MQSVRPFALLMLCLLPALSGCGLFDQKAVKSSPKNITGVEYTGGDFLIHLSLAELALNNGTPNLAMAEASLKAVESFTGKKGKSAPQEALVFECKGKSNLTLLAPLSLQEPEYSGIETLSKALRGKCILQNVWPASVQLSHKPALTFKIISAEASRIKIHSRLVSVLGTATRYDAKKETQAYIRLTRAFIGAGDKEGAYLALDNGKHALAKAEAAKAGPTFIQQSGEAFENLEREVKQTL